MNDLLPCPFCGDKKPQIISSQEFGIAQKQIICPTCGARSAGKLLQNYKGEEDWVENLTKVWNRRVKIEEKD